jgi:hypothetical protein
MHLIKPDDLKIRNRAVLMVLIGWFPLLLLTALQDVLHGGNSWRMFVLDVGSWTRYVIAAPLFVVAESLCFPRFERIIRHFRDSGLIADSDRERYADIMQSSSRLLKSRAAEIISFVIAYTIVFAWYVERPPNSLIGWSYKAGGGALSLAGKWHVIVTLPLLLVLIFGWIWRQCVWARFLWLVSRMDLKLIPTHPDQCGGLKFVATVIRAYVPIAFACTCIIAGGIASRMLYAGGQLQSYRDVMIVVVFLIGLFCIAPLLVFAPVLRKLRAKAIFEYGAACEGNRNAAGGKMAWLSRQRPG